MFSLHLVKRPIWLLALFLLLAACSRDHTPAPPSPALSTATGAAPAVTEQTPTPFQPSPTPAPLAARINGDEIGLAEYQAELARYRAASGTDLATEEEQFVLDDLINQVLLSQAAAEQGFAVDEAMLEERLNQLTGQLGGAQALSEWLAAHGYTEEAFRKDLARSISAAWMRDQIAAAVPQAAEQIHARQILVYQPDQANEVLAQLQAGRDFAALALEYNAVTGGDLGWFPQGYLPDAAIEEAAFSLEPGQTSGLIETPAGFHILQVIERDPQRPLAPDVRLELQARALQSWIETRRSQSDIQVLAP